MLFKFLSLRILLNPDKVSKGITTFELFTNVMANVAVHQAQGLPQDCLNINALRKFKKFLSGSVPEIRFDRLVMWHYSVVVERIPRIVLHFF